MAWKWGIKLYEAMACKSLASDEAAFDPCFKVSLCHHNESSYISLIIGSTASK